ncbi:hypothetical protein FHX49_001571 [Microbacterium endophyticum]|uniref:Uncharacterized protein n=1 Tax=Microbacterium endophyticum TaxID=1526412 RepID=A0A7W4YNS3_9MICO|nr:hypothetical protein [Microbacterium endophyticum]MBB2976001.1 hypothetical protein [Microbacterium endophyticum]NIK35080.1 hypothetical protein [Microbacterium endophyticum]
MTVRQLRALRGALAAIISVILASVSHTVGGGEPPSAALVCATILLAWPVATFAVGRTRGVFGTSAAVLSAQALLHIAFAMTAGVTLDSTLVPPGMHQHHEMVELLAPATEMSMGWPDTPMLTAHVVAAIAAFAALRHGESVVALVLVALWQVAARAGAVPSFPAHAAPSAPVGAVEFTLARILADAPFTPRGPPSLLGDSRIA